MAGKPNNLDAKLWRRASAGADAPGECPDAMRLASYIDGRVDAAEAERFEAHLAACAACRRALRETRELLAGGPAMTPPKLVASAKALVAAKRVRLRRVAGWAAAAAASVAIGLSGFFAGSATQRGRQLAEARVVEEASFGLADGADESAVLDAYVLAALGNGNGGVR